VSRFDVSDDALSALGQRAKQQLRARMRGTRRALSGAAVLARSARIIAALRRIEAFERARSVGLFWPIEALGEVDLRALDQGLAERGVARYYPFMDPKPGGFTTGFRRIEQPEELQLRGQKFAEPPRDAKRAERGDIDVVLVPALAITPEGHRLGHGVGFYDATLPDVAPPALSIALAFSFQLLAELYVEPHDVACDAVITDTEIFDAKGALRAWVPPPAYL
jgi:5-formyltetrahydrofolate cyclo-ligase